MIVASPYKKDPSNYWGLLGKLTVKTKSTAPDLPIEFNNKTNTGHFKIGSVNSSAKPYPNDQIQPSDVLSTN